MEDRTDIMEDRKYKNYELVLKVFTPLLTVAGLVISVLLFNWEQAAQSARQQAATAEGNRIEFNRRMWEKQLDAYMRFSRVVGKIAAANRSQEELTQDIDEFFTLYWGEMIFYEDKEVEAASSLLRDKIEDFLHLGTQNRDEVKLSAQHLIETCKRSSRRSWSGPPDGDFPPPPELECFYCLRPPLHGNARR